MKCDECNGKIIHDFVRNEHYCKNCGLVLEPNHRMGHTINDLVSYINYINLGDIAENIQMINMMDGLAAARLEVAKLEAA